MNASALAFPAGQSAASMDFLRAQMREALARAPRSALSALDGRRFLVTGASGFFGAWILLAFEALRERGVVVEAAALSRDPAAFARRWPALCASPSLSWIEGGFGQIEQAGRVDGILHLAGSSDKAGNDARPFEMAAMTLEGAVACAQKAERDGARWLLTSSGAVYGRRALSEGLAREADATRSAPDPLGRGSAPGYGQAKRLAEWVGAQSGAVVARPFAFLGPLLPLDWHFAAGNFARDALAGRSVELLGDGSPLRSYMHPADLAAWLLALWANGEPAEAYNVGGEQTLALWDLAGMFSRLAGSPPPQRRREPALGADPELYAPDCAKARALGLSLAFSLERSAQSLLDHERLRGAGSAPA
jgi:nucleoside-diphosphate-sugar epimerase